MPSAYSGESEGKFSHEHEYTSLWLQPLGTLRSDVLRIYEGDRGLPLHEDSPWERPACTNDAICMHLKEPRTGGSVFPGNWQAEIISAAGKSTAVGVLMEVGTLFTVLVSLEGDSATSAIGGFAEFQNRIDAQKALCIAYGKNPDDITNFTPCAKSSISVYFYDPTLTRRVGLHEYIRPFLQAHLPSGVDVFDLSQNELDHLAFIINSDRNQFLKWKCPLELFLQDFFRFDYELYSKNKIKPRVIGSGSRIRPSLSNVARNESPKEGKAIWVFFILSIVLICVFGVFYDYSGPHQNRPAPELAPSAEFLRLQAQAEKGIVDAQFRLGLAYAQGREENGDSVPLDRAAAMKWYGLAAEHGHVPAQFNLAQLYETDDPMPEDAPVSATPYEPSQEDNAKAVHWYRAAADQGYAPAQLRLGRRYALGNGVPRNPNEAIRLLRLSDPQASSVLEAIEMFGLLYARGGDYIGHSPEQYVTIQADFATADVFLREAWASGSTRAPEEYGDMYVRGIIDELEKSGYGVWAVKAESGWSSSHIYDSAFLSSTEIAFQIRDFKSDANEAVSAYRVAVDRGSTSAAYKLGEMFAYGLGVGMDMTKAERWYRVAVDGGSEDAAFQLGEIYFHGKGGHKNIIVAERWYQRAGPKGAERLQAWVPKKIETEPSTAKNEGVTSLVLLGAAHLGDAKAQLSAGYAYHSGDGFPKDYGEAAKWFCTAAKQGSERAQFACGLAYAKGEGVKEDAAEAAKWYRLAADQGFAPAQANLGLLYLSGKGVPQDFEQGVRLLRLAAEDEDADAQAALGNVYLSGQGVDRDYMEAMQWYRLAADRGNAYAQRSIGNLYLHGKGVQRDAAEAMKWYWFAAKQGDGAAQKNLGDMYVRGNPVKRNYVLGYMWYNLAAASGSADDAVRLRDKLVGKMSLAQTREAQQLSSACRERNFQQCYGNE